MTTVFTVAALLERLLFLLPDATPKIEPLRAQLKQIIEVADAYRNITDEQAKAIMNVSYALEDQIESYVRNVSSRRNGFLSRIFKRSSEQFKVIENLLEILSGKIIQLPTLTDSSPGPKHHGPEIVEHRILSSRAALAADTEGIIGMEDAKNKLVSDLTSGASQLTLVSIFGMGGIGKTTMAVELFRSPAIRYHFHRLAWICVSEEYETRHILQVVLSQISNRRDAISLNQDVLAERIYKSLKGQRYLIVLDDIWSADTWFSLRMVFPDDNNGSRILITTRMEDIANQVGSVIHPIRPLTEEESWSLFRRKVELVGTMINLEKEQIGREIVRQSGGLPLAIVTLAGALRGRPLDEWRRALEQISNPSSDLDRLFDALNFSYNYLPLHLRPCLPYLGTFPEDAEIEMDTLCQLLIAEGLVSMVDTGNEETMMDVAARYLDELEKRGFVEIPEDKVSGQRKSCMIHDLIRDFCVRKGKEDEFFEVIDLGDENDQTMTSAIRRAIYLDRYEYTHSHLYGNANYLRSLLFFSTSKSETGIIWPRDIPNLDHFMWVRVLYVSGVDFKGGKLPKGVEKLVYLRYLSFRECYLEELSSSVGNMLYLQTLDLRIRNECELTIPDILNNLENLKYLYLPLAYRTHNHEKLHLGKLKELEILENFDTSQCNVDDLPGLTKLKELVITIDGDISDIERFLEARVLRSTSLNIRNFDCHSKRRFSAMEKAFNSSALESFGVVGYLGKLPKLYNICPKLTRIVLNGSELREDPMQVLPKIPSLSCLVLEIEAYVGKEMKCSPSGFPELRYLKLSELYNLEEWEVEEEAMPKLCNLVIKNCRKLEMLPDGLQFVTKLRKLEIFSMPGEFVGRIQMPDGTNGVDFYKIERAYPKVKIDGQRLILQERQQAGEDPQSSSCSKSPGEKQEISELNSTEIQE